MQTMEVSLQEVRCGSKKALRGPSSRGLCKIVRQWFYWHTQIMTNTTIPKHRSLNALKLHFCFPESHEWSNRAPCVSLPTPEITVQIQTLLAPCCVREIGRQFLSFLNLLARKIELSPMIQRGTRTSTIGFLLRITISKYYIILLYDIAKPSGRFLGASPFFDMTVLWSTLCVTLMFNKVKSTLTATDVVLSTIPSWMDTIPFGGINIRKNQLFGCSQGVPSC